MNSIGTFSGQVVHGNHIGETRLDSPTANIIPEAGTPIPPFGVYASRVTINGAAYWGVTNVGRRPTLQDAQPVSVETYIFGLDESLYGRRIRVDLLAFLRAEKKFSSIEALRIQIAKDKAAALRYSKGASL